jgi:hypothetical protein
VSFSLCAGAAYVFSRLGVDSAWSEDQKLTASGGAFDDVFGKDVSVSDGVLAVGASNDADKGPDAGGLKRIIVYMLFIYMLFYLCIWSLSIPCCYINRVNCFPVSLCAGAAYIFSYSDVYSAWSQEQKIVATDGGSDDKFGGSVSVCGGVFAVGATKNTYEGHTAGGLYRRLCLLALLCMY